MESGGEGLSFSLSGQFGLLLCLAGEEREMIR